MIRIGAVSYLNTKPLIFGLENRLPEARLLLDVPSKLADRVHAGNLDVALIPSVEFLRGSELAVVSDACIACRGPVRSVCVLFNKAPWEVETLALDEGSRTSAVLAQLLLARRYGCRPDLQPLPLAAPFDQCDADAVLVIGDRAMKLDAADYFDVWDLGQEWNRLTGLPFVFAMWVTANPELSLDVGPALESCRDDGLRRIDEIVQAESGSYGLSPRDCYRYFTQQLHFGLGPAELEGLDLFRRQAAELGILPASCKQLSLEPI